MDDASRFEEAVAALYSPLHQARTPEALKLTAMRRTRTIEDIREYMNRIGLNELPSNVVHITGTKGKGSTACMCEAILRERYCQTTGLFTSPHLVDIRERIRVNGKPVSQQVFAEAYWEVRRRLEDKAGEDDLPVLPGYFRMLLLVALYIFTHYEPHIDVVILEVGMGGRYDATNVLDMEDRNVVCGVTLLDFDHTRVLGNTIEQIAWEKGGIFQVQKGSTDASKRPTEDTITSDSFSASARENDSKTRLFAIGTNSDSALAVLHNCAAVEGRGQTLQVINEGRSLPAGISLGLQGDHQLINAELAVALCEALAEHLDDHPDLGVEAMHRALENTSWPGRCQSVQVTTNDDTPMYVRLDGAHTVKSVQAGMKWFTSISGYTTSDQKSDNDYRVLIFNCSHERNPVELLQLFAYFQQDRNPLFQSVYFCPADFERPSMVGKPTAREMLTLNGIEVDDSIDDDREGKASLTWQDTLADVWRHIEARKSTGVDTEVAANLNVSEAFDRIRAIRGKERIDVFVAGSLYIVGSALDAVNWKEDVAFGTLA